MFSAGVTFNVRINWFALIFTAAFIVYLQTVAAPIMGWGLSVPQMSLSPHRETYWSAIMRAAFADIVRVYINFIC